MSLCRDDQLRSHQMSAEMEIVLSFQQRILALPTMPLSLPICSHQGIRSWDESRHRRLLVFFFLRSLGHVFVLRHKLLPLLHRGAVHVWNDLLFRLSNRRRAGPC